MRRNGACDLPLLRKDFIIDTYQLHEASAAGADAVLLIVAALEQGDLTLRYMRRRGRSGWTCSWRYTTARSCSGHLRSGRTSSGINNRDLRDFSVDVERTERLMDAIPSEVRVVSESGIAGAEQICGCASAA